MPCPYFEPITPVSPATFGYARLPLIEGYAGRCPHGGDNVSGQPCNQGYPSGSCQVYPAGQPNRAHRYSLQSTSAAELALVFIIEEAHAPVLFRTLRYSVEEDRLLEAGLDTPLDAPAAAQASAFCRSYLKLRRVERF